LERIPVLSFIFITTQNKTLHKKVIFVQKIGVSKNEAVFGVCFWVLMGRIYCSGSNRFWHGSASLDPSSKIIDPGLDPDPA
jgi:hypothetical protein